MSLSRTGPQTPARGHDDPFSYGGPLTKHLNPSHAKVAPPPPTERAEAPQPKDPEAQVSGGNGLEQDGDLWSSHAMLPRRNEIEFLLMTMKWVGKKKKLESNPQLRWAGMKLS